jgi:hypothetical protein
MGCMAELDAWVLFTLLFDMFVFLKGMTENAEKEINIRRTQTSNGAVTERHTRVSLLMTYLSHDRRDEAE